MPEDLTVIKRYPSVASFGADLIGPSEEPPEIVFESEIYESKVQSNGGVMPAAKIVTLRKVKITIDTKNIDWAMTQLEALEEGDDIYAAANKKALTLVPVPAGEKTLTFESAYLEPDSDYKAPANKDHSMKLTYDVFEKQSLQIGIGDRIMLKAGGKNKTGEFSNGEIRQYNFF